MAGKIKQPKVPQACSICGKEFMPTSGYISVCDECKEFVKGYRTIKNNYDVNGREARIRAEATQRAKRNDRIIGEGYAKRQIARTLSMVSKINTEI